VNSRIGELELVEAALAGQVGEAEAAGVVERRAEHTADHLFDGGQPVGREPEPAKLARDDLATPFRSRVGEVQALQDSVQAAPAPCAAREGEGVAFGGRLVGGRERDVGVVVGPFGRARTGERREAGQPPPRRHRPHERSRRERLGVGRA
jgi:hypothetical protein